jgi:TolB-like protein/class 3 adenylate cyclase/Tfp pilus assembly protein PilF
MIRLVALEPQTTAGPELAHVLFLDIVGCSKLPSDEQQRIVARLQEVVRASAEYQRAQEKEQVISLPTGDGMALVFFNKLDGAVLCAVEITRSIQAESLGQIRMGLHSGPVFVMEDINHKRNVSGAGINLAERVMSCGAAGHILLSEHAAESLRHLSAWRDKIQNIGECRVKDGWIKVSNLVDGPVGNPAFPEKSRRYAQRRRNMIAAGVTALALAVIASLAGAFWLGKGVRSAPLEEQSIAVLPFIDMSPEKNQEYFADGLAEELLDALTKVPELRVACRNSSFQFKDNSVDLQTIGKKLNVATILEGSVRKQGNRAKISVQLIKAADGFQLWSDSYNHVMNDIFSVQEDIAKAVAGSLKLTLLRRKSSATGGNTNAEAYNDYLQGRYFLQRHTPGDLENAVSYFEQSVKLGPGYARALVGLAESRSGQALAGGDPPENWRKAREAAASALTLDPDLAEAHAASAWIKQFADWDWDGADASYKRALALDPGNGIVISHAGVLARILGHWDEAVALGRHATQMDPLSNGTWQNAGITFYYAGRNEEAIAAFRKALELVPAMPLPHNLLGRVYLASSQPQQALAEMENEPHPVFRLFGLALAYQALGRGNESQASLAELNAKYPPPGYLAVEVYAFRGEADRAFEVLEKAYARHESGLSQLKGDPLLKSLERDPRYAAWLRKMRLPF